MTSWLEWIGAHQTALWWLAAISVPTFVVSLILVPVMIARIPRNYFQQERRPPSAWANQHPALRVLSTIAKNAVGILFVIAGLMMLVLPGQGIVTMIIGITLLDFPGKFRLERWFISHPPVLRSINWLRQRAKQEPLVVQETPLTRIDESNTPS